jgi:hypothetical protein
LAQTNTQIAQLEAENAQLCNNTAVTQAKIEAPPKYGGNKEDLAG